ncbi:unnamed protein product [Durusdinium trenchii]
MWAPPLGPTWREDGLCPQVKENENSFWSKPKVARKAPAAPNPHVDADSASDWSRSAARSVSWCSRVGWQIPLSLEEVREAADKGELWAVKALEQLRKLERCANDPVRLHLSSCAWLHRIASQQGRTRYVDPRTGLGVFTATALKTGACCGLHCRHCPHGQGPGGLLTAEEKITMLDW